MIAIQAIIGLHNKNNNNTLFPTPCAFKCMVVTIFVNTRVHWNQRGTTIVGYGYYDYVLKGMHISRLRHIMK